MRRLLLIVLVALLPAAALAQPPGRWTGLAVVYDMAVYVDAASVMRKGDTVSATVLIVTDQPMMWDGAVIAAMRSNYVFNCKARTYLQPSWAGYSAAGIEVSQGAEASTPKPLVANTDSDLAADICDVTPRGAAQFSIPLTISDAHMRMDRAKFPVSPLPLPQGGYRVVAEAADRIYLLAINETVRTAGSVRFKLLEVFEPGLRVGPDRAMQSLEVGTMNCDAPAYEQGAWTGYNLADKALITTGPQEAVTIAAGSPLDTIFQVMCRGKPSGRNESYAGHAEALANAQLLLRR